MKITAKRIAIIHDSMQYFGGAERTLISLCSMYPDADVYTSVISWQNMGKFKLLIESLRIKTSWLQNIYLFRTYPIFFRYLLPLVWGCLDLSSYDVVISTSGAQMSHLIKVPSKTLHICYCFTPPRHLYGYRTDFHWEKHSLTRGLLLLGNYTLRFFNHKSVQTIDHFIACSKEVSGRIHRFYQRKSVVIYPPARPPLPAKKNLKNQEYFLVVSRLSRMKHIDKIITAANMLHIKLQIVGIGPEEKKLKQIAGHTIQFVGQLDDESLAQKYQNAKALICCAQDEDFGITPVESQYYGTPVIALYSGGYKETIQKYKTGVFFDEPSAEAIVNAIQKFNQRTFSKKVCINSASRFSEKKFKGKMRAFILAAWKAKQKTII